MGNVLGDLGSGISAAWNAAQSVPVVGPIVKTISGHATPAQPGVGGPAKDPTKLVQDPQTGLYFDPTTGTSYTDPTGQSPVTNPNVAQQVAANFAASRSALAGLGGFDAEHAAAAGDQQALTGLLQNAAIGRGPNVAGAELQAGLGTIASQQLAQAAGTSGAASPLAQMLAARNTAAAGVGANQAAAIAQQKEMENSRALLEHLLGARVAGADQAYGEHANLGLGLANTAEGGQEANQGLQQKGDQYNQDLFTKYLGAGAKAFGDSGSLGG